MRTVNHAEINRSSRSWLLTIQNNFFCCCCCCCCCCCVRYFPASFKFWNCHRVFKFLFKWFGHVGRFWLTFSCVCVCVCVWWFWCAFVAAAFSMFCICNSRCRRGQPKRGDFSLSPSFSLSSFLDIFFCLIFSFFSGLETGLSYIHIYFWIFLLFSFSLSFLFHFFNQNSYLWLGKNRAGDDLKL